MKIERVNEHQIRCTLTQADLASRELKLSELAYGSEKAKELFRDMMEKANDEYGFEAENIPLMIEAIPINSECIVLIITKVEDPEELDTRFSKFAPSVHEESDDYDDDGSDTSADSSSNDIVNISDLFNRFKNAVSDGKSQKPDLSAFEGMAFSFESVSELASVCKTVAKFFDATSSLYRNNSTGLYLLTVNRGKLDISDFVQACNIFSEYGAMQQGKLISEAYIREHYETICQENAISTLAEIG